MATTIKLSDELIVSARRYGELYSRSVHKQIEYWSRIGRITEENPDLTYRFIHEILIAQQESSEHQVTPYQFG